MEAGEWVINARAKNTEGWAVEAVNAAGHVIKLPNGKNTILYPLMGREQCYLLKSQFIAAKFHK